MTITMTIATFTRFHVLKTFLITKRSYFDNILVLPIDNPKTISHHITLQDKEGALSLTDLVGICCDVSAGCAYLEALHFVHRYLIPYSIPSL